MHDVVLVIRVSFVKVLGQIELNLLIFVLICHIRESAGGSGKTCGIDISRHIV